MATTTKSRPQTRLVEAFRRSQRADAKALYRRLKKTSPSHLPENR